MRPVVPSLLSLLLVAIGCGAGSSPTGVKDGGDDGPTAEGGDGGGCFPFCSGSSSGSSGGSGGGDAASDAPATCAQQAAVVAQLQAAAQTCNPQLPSQCTGITQGICCALTISSGNDMAVNAYASAVTSYKSACSPTCMGSVCPTAPSQKCDSSATGVGTCQ